MYIIQIFLSSASVRSDGDHSRILDLGSNNRLCLEIRLIEETASSWMGAGERKMNNAFFHRKIKKSSKEASPMRKTWGLLEGAPPTIYNEAAHLEKLDNKINKLKIYSLKL